MNYIGYQENDSQYAKLIEEVKQRFYIDAKKLESKEVKAESPANNTGVTTVRSTGKSGGITYNKEQKSAIINAVSFLKTNTDPTQYYVIEGKAGTGKTTIAKEILKQFKDQQVYIAAVSHKAKSVIKNSFGEDTRRKKFFSIAGLLGMKGVNDNDTQTTKFQEGTKVPLQDNPPALLVIDEASMITEDILSKIIEINQYVTTPFQMLFLGDIGQIQPIRDEQSEFYRTHKELLNKKSNVFNSKHKSKLITRVRQGEANPILPYADYFWENSQKENPELNPTQHIVRNNQITDKGSLLFSNSEGEVLNSVIKAMKNAVEKGLTNHVKIVTYHVNEKSELNQKIHETLFGKDSDYSKGDFIILNQQFDVLPYVTMENSTEMQITGIKDIEEDENGIHILSIETNGSAYDVHDGTERKNCTIQVVSRNDIAKYKDILQEMATKAKRQANGPHKRELWKQFWRYKGLYADVDFGYAITAHKSQGSTYDIVVVDEKDIMGTSATSNQEKSELIYTALTRPRKTAIVISSVPVSNPYTGDIENPSLPKQAEKKIEYHPGNWTRQEVNDNPDVLYITNTDYQDTNLSNMLLVSTRNQSNTSNGIIDNGNWNDSDIDDFKKVIDAEFQAIKDEWDTGKYRKIYLPSTGLSNGKISQITEARTPVLFKYLYDKTADLAKYVGTEHNSTRNDYSDYFQNTHSDNVVVEDVVKPWKSDSSKQNKTRRIYLKGKENKGYFEVVKDLEDNNYSVHFKPTDSKNPNAFTQEEKAILFQAVADVIPDGANLSTWGELTKGGIHGLNRFADLGFTKTGERSAKTKAGEDIKIPIFTKLTKSQSTLQNKQNNNSQDYTMNSGGAYGGDTYWDVIGRQFGLTKINHFRPADNQRLSKTLRDRNVKPFSITHEQSNYAREQIKQLTGRDLPYDIGGELLARDFYQVDKSDGVFAISNITSSQKAVQGGTNMAVQVGIKQGKPVHVYDLNTENWYQYNQSTGRFEVEDTPVLTKSFAGVGTRNIQNYKVNKNGQWVDREGYVGYDKALKAANAIKAVYQKTFNNVPTSSAVNIYAGTGENADLSNFAIRPFTHHFNDGSVKEFQSVEQAFQYIKASKFADTRSNDGNTRPSGKSIQAEIMDTTTGSQLRSLGRQIRNLNVQAWDRSSSFIMKQLLKESFEQNPQALQRLLSTGNATLTHVQDNSKWGKEFPKLLMEVREELRKKQDSYKVKNDQDIKDDLKELGKRRQDDCNK